MEYCFDSIFVKNGKIFATGWAVSSVAENEIEITVTDEKRHQLMTIVTWAARPDVVLLNMAIQRQAMLESFLRFHFMVSIW
mgnify:CR=1 FL=1